MINFKHLMLGAVATGLVFSVGVDQAQADPEMIGSGTDKTELSISGFVNRAIMVADDGDDTEVFFGDNPVASSEIGFDASGKISEDLTVMARIGLSFSDNALDSVSFTSGEDSPSGSDIGIDNAFVAVESKTFGTLSTGQMSDAADGAFGIDLSGTDLSGAYADLDDIGGGLVFKTSAGATSSKNIGDSWFGGDGTETDLVRYDSPKFGGLGIHASMAQGGWGIVAASYEAEIADFTVVGAVGYSNASSSDALAVNDHWVGSASVLHSSGISLTGAFTVVNELENISAGTNRDEPVTLYGKLGYQENLVDLGKSYFSVSYGVSEDSQANGDELEIFQLGFVQDIDAAASELYLAVTAASLDDSSSTDYEDIVYGVAGARVKF